MKKSFITIGFIICFIFPTSVFASDTLKVSTHSSKSDTIIALLDTMILGNKPFNTMALNIDGRNDLPIIDNIRNLNQKDRIKFRLYDSYKIIEIKENNPLLDSILNYDTNVTRVHPRPARIFLPNEVLDEPKMSPLFMPLVFNAINRKFKIERNGRDKNELMQYFRSAHLDSLRTIYRSERFIRNLAQTIMLNSETKQIGGIKYDQKNLPKPEQMVFHLNSSKAPVWWSKAPEAIPGREVNTTTLPKTVYKPWNKHGFIKLQFSQTYNSPNWSKGGESNMAGMTTIYYEADYADLEKVQFDNYVEIKIGLNTVSSDSLRSLNVSTDQFKMVSKLGIKMYNNWFYSLSGEFTTQLLNNYKANTMQFKTSLLSPAKLFIGLGVDYKKVNAEKGYNLSVILAPMTCKMNYLRDIRNFKPASYGIDNNRHFGAEFGSKLTATLTWKFSDQVQWRSKFYYFSDYSYIDSEWENTLDLNLNHYFSTTIFMLLKYDDRLKPDPGQHLLQMQELLSFGMIYRL
ncbi:MAG: DUF3078 domain-containing protein [Bacteroidales bacterium]|nr:DUF3078 domain-containing protein [Bacteroidales bacterium]